ncbi:MAG: hypothetical protein Tsb0017_10060 [Geothermobacteraceae bacterium]
MLRIAVPYYGYLMAPKHGLANLFYLVDVDLIRAEVARVSLETRIVGKRGDLASWLQKKGVGGVISKDLPLATVQELKSAGLWHRKVEGMDLEEQLTSWWRLSADGELWSEALSKYFEKAER